MHPTHDFATCCVLFSKGSANIGSISIKLVIQKTRDCWVHHSILREITAHQDSKVPKNMINTPWLSPHHWTTCSAISQKLLIDSVHSAKELSWIQQYDSPVDCSESSHYRFPLLCGTPFAIGLPLTVSENIWISQRGLEDGSSIVQEDGCERRGASAEKAHGGQWKGLAVPPNHSWGEDAQHVTIESD